MAPALQELATALCVLAAALLSWHGGRSLPSGSPAHVLGFAPRRGGGSFEAEASLAGRRRLLYMDDGVTDHHMDSTSMDGLGATVPDLHGPFYWASVYQRKGSPIISRSGWRRDPDVQPQAFVHLDGTATYTAGDLARLLAGKRVTVIGDSLSNQVEELLILSLQRQGYEDYITQLPRRYSCNGTLHSTMEELEQNFYYTAPDDADFWPRKKLLDKQCETVLDSFVIGGPFKNMTWTYYKAYMLYEQDGEKVATYILWPGMLDHLFNNSDIVIANFGVHYRMNEWEDRLTYTYSVLAERMEAFNKHSGKLDFFRQTLPQHFYSKGGSGQYKSNAKLRTDLEPEFATCHYADNINMQLWRHRLMQEAAKPRGLAIMPVFWEMDKPEFHVNTLPAPSFRDCTHFASVPDWWIPVYDSMYRTAATELCKKGEVDRSYCLGF